MTNIGFIGLGKLGYPMAAMMAMAGHKIIGHDINTHAMSHGEKPYREAGLKSGHTFKQVQEAAKSNMSFCSTVPCLVRNSDVIFVCVQSPHAARFDGTHPLTDDRADFDYTHLIQACREIRAAMDDGAPKTIAIISTVLPGTIRRLIMPIFENVDADIIHNPEFMAMGTVLQNFVEPEFIVIGRDYASREHGRRTPQEDVIAVHKRVYKFYHEVLCPPRAKISMPTRIRISALEPQKIPIATMSIESAELAKLAYNTFISTKIAFANTIGELAHKTGADADDVMATLKASTERLISPKYLDPGMGDGGGCHPRDNIAMSWLAEEKGLSFDFFRAIMEQRDEHAEWLAGEWIVAAYKSKLPLVIAGTEFKPETLLTDGSPALLVKAMAESSREKVYTLNGHPSEPAAYFIGCKHAAYANTIWPKGSVIIDPFRYIPDQEGVEVIRIGEGKIGTEHTMT